MSFQESAIARVFSLALLLALANGAQKQVKLFDVRKYGAAADGKTDNTKAFLDAWRDACNWNGGGARLYVAPGKFVVRTVQFEGPCGGPMVFQLKGVLMAPPDPLHGSYAWITFRYIDKLVVNGGGTLDGRGKYAWSRNQCHKNPDCQPLPTSMSLEFVSNSRIHHIRSVDSKNAHFKLFACENLNMTNMRLTAPADSPNTDGIKIGSSTHIKISDVVIGTGDDCISFLSGTTNVEISRIRCGPGHGISIGSLGRFPDEEDVVGLLVKNCTISGASNGVRIKAWGSSTSRIVASNFTFEDIIMENVANPIIIDQQYCPYPPCSKTPSHVQIRDVTYKDIRGTSSTKVAVDLQCSEKFPCKNIVMNNINLAHQGPEGPAKSSCSYVNGISYGDQSPPSCLSD